MHKGKRGVLFVFSGPSGVGKGTLKAKLFEEFAGRRKPPRWERWR